MSQDVGRLRVAIAPSEIPRCQLTLLTHRQRFVQRVESRFVREELTAARSRRDRVLGVQLTEELVTKHFHGRPIGQRIFDNYGSPAVSITRNKINGINNEYVTKSYERLTLLQSR